MKKIFLFIMIIGVLLVNRGLAQLQDFESLRNTPLGNSPLEIIRDIENLNTWYVNYRQDALSGLSEKVRLKRGKEIAETIGLQVVRTRNVWLLNAHVLRLRHKIEELENALTNDNYPYLWMRQSDELILDRSRNRLATIEGILDSIETREFGILDVAITDISAFISQYYNSASDQSRRLIQTSDNSPGIRLKSAAMASHNPYLPAILLIEMEEDPDLEKRWMDYLSRRGISEDIRTLGRPMRSRESLEELSPVVNDFFKLEEDIEILRTLEEEASFLEDALMTMYGNVSLSVDRFVRVNTPLIANLFELRGSHSRLADIQRLIGSPENANLKQRLESLQTDLTKIVSLIPTETTENSLESSCRKTSKWVTADTDVNSHAAAFLEALNISSTGSGAPTNDLSFMFLRPTLQGASLSCVAHAVASDMEFEINKANQTQIDIDEEYTYLQVQIHPFGGDETRYNWQNPISIEVKDKLSEGIWSDYDYPDHGVSSIFNLSRLGPLGFTWHAADRSYSKYYRDIDGVLAEIEPEDHQGERQEVIDRLRSKPRYAVETYVHYNEPGLRGEQIDCSFIRLLIDNKQPPLVSLHSNARKLGGEDWLHIPPMGTDIRHLALIIGYGEGIDPRDMVRKPYFILSDSFVDEPIHYKVAADELLSQISNIHKITQVVHLNPEPSNL